MLTIATGHVNYVTKGKIYLIRLIDLPAALQDIVTMTEKDLAEALKKTACRITDVASLHPAPRAYSSFLWTCEYSVGNYLQKVGVATITKVPVGLDKFRFVLRVYKYLYQRTQLHILDYEEVGPIQQVPGTTAAFNVFSISNCSTCDTSLSVTRYSRSQVPPQLTL